jgi:phage terminase Nu1 subunit (DNA packaging protein)
MAKLAEAAAHIDLKERRFRQLVQAGVIPRSAPGGSYDLDEVRVAYIRYLREQAAGRVGVDPKADAVAANVRWKAALAELLELRLRKEAGDLLDRNDVGEVWGRIMIGTRNLVLGIPSAFHFEEPSLTPHARKALERICRDRLMDASMGRGFAVLDPGERCGECGRPVIDGQHKGEGEGVVDEDSEH